ncbi:hypothetical protein [Kaistella sp.]|uniref:hypothetical protein n=1 Tax=Kaistella sp. TaxID=2782235 RepID=UPI003C5E753D
MVLFSILILFLTKEYGDYSSMVYDIFIIPFLIILILINLAILYSADFYNLKKKKGNFKTTNRVVLGLFFIFIIHFSTNYYMGNKEVYLISNLNNSKGKLILYKNNTFKISMFWNHGSDNFLGNYDLKNDKLTLKKDSLEKITNYKFTYNYVIFPNDKSIKPNEISFENLTIE